MFPELSSCDVWTQRIQSKDVRSQKRESKSKYMHNKSQNSKLQSDCKSRNHTLTLDSMTFC